MDKNFEKLYEAISKSDFLKEGIEEGDGDFETIRSLEPIAYKPAELVSAVKKLNLSKEQIKDLAGLKGEYKKEFPEDSYAVAFSNIIGSFWEDYSKKQPKLDPMDDFDDEDDEGMGLRDDHLVGPGGPIKLHAETQAHGSPVQYEGFPNPEAVHQFMMDRDKEMMEDDFRNWPEGGIPVMTLQNGDEYAMEGDFWINYETNKKLTF